jgi:hypothetical protein
LAVPDLDLKLDVNVSSVGAGAFLLQADANGVFHPVCYFSRKCDENKLKHSTIVKKLLLFEVF